MMIFVMITEQFLQFGNIILPGEAMNVFPIIKCYLEEKWQTESALKMSAVKQTLHKWKEAQAVVMSCYLLKPLRSLAAAFRTRWRWERARKEEVAAVQTDVGEML